MQAIVFAEHNHQTLHPSTRHCVSAALAMQASVTVLVAGADCQAVAEQAALLSGVQQVLCADHPVYAQHLAEPCAALLIHLAEQFDAILAPATTLGKNILPRVAAALSVAQISDITAVVDAQTFERPIYAGNAIAVVQSTDAKKVLTVRSTAFPKVELNETPVAIESVMFVADVPCARFVDRALSDSERPELTQARVVVSGGRALKSAENFQLIEALADKLNAAIGASRAAVDAGFVANDYQVGQTGKVVAPELYVAIGISGAIQHVAGIKDSKVIVAINQDPDAPIFQVADYGLVGDLFEIVPQLTAALAAKDTA